MRLVDQHIPVLLVDSNVFSSCALKLLFDDVEDGFEFEHDVTGVEVVDKISDRLSQNRSPYKLIIVDSSLASIQGITVCEEIIKYY